MNNIKLVLVLSLLGASSIYAQDANYLTIGSVEVSKIQRDVLNQEVSETLYESRLNYQELLDLQGMPNKMGQDSSNSAGKIIGVAKELVALGEDIYKLVQKGKPHNTVTYAPISVIPKLNGMPIDIFETENWKMPSKRTYKITYKNLYGMEVVKFRYSVIFSHGGTYQGTGAYISGALIIPESIMTSFGFDFSATMKLQSIQNHGTKQKPIAGAVMTMEYTVNTVLQAILNADSYHITGQGGFKQL